MLFHSILTPGADDKPTQETPQAPDFFADLNLGPVMSAITARKGEYNLAPFFYTPLHDLETIHYRQEVMQEMEDAVLLAKINAFAEEMVAARRALGVIKQVDFIYHKRGWFLEAALLYCAAVNGLARDLAEVQLQARGLVALREYVTTYAQSQAFRSLQAEAQAVKDQLAALTYSVIVEAGKFRVRKYAGEPDYTVEVEQLFEKFKQGAVKDYRVKFQDEGTMGHISAKILEFVARLYPEPFAALDHFCVQHSNFMDATLVRFDREIQFYVAYLQFVAELKHKGLRFCYPEMSVTSREVYAVDAFDIALAHALQHTQQPVIGNDFSLQGPERIIVVSGPNQGGKTTFARMFAQVHYFASLGCPVPGQAARLFLFDRLLVHFEREEDIHNLRGKLQDDLVRMHAILAQATPNSILVLNELFSSTSMQDAIFLSKEVMAKVMALDALCIWVTFLDELSALNEKTVSMVSTVVPENPAERTFKVVRRPADGLAYAHSIAQKYRLSYEQIKERIQP